MDSLTHKIRKNLSNSPCELDARCFSHTANFRICFSLIAALNSLPANILANLISCVSKFRRKLSASLPFSGVIFARISFDRVQNYQNRCELVTKRRTAEKNTLFRTSNRFSRMNCARFCSKVCFPTRAISHTHIIEYI